MKKEDIDFLETIKKLTYGVEDFIKMGDEDWKHHSIEMLSEIRNEILKYKQIKNPVKTKEYIFNPKEGTPEERLYAYFIRKFKELPEENIFLTDKEIQDMIETEFCETNPGGMMAFYNKYFYSFIKSLEEAFKKIIPQRREQNKQTELFKTK